MDGHGLQGTSWPLALAVVLFLAGCATTPEPTRTVEPPEGTTWAQCPPTASRPMAIDLRVAVENETGGRPAGIHRLDARTFLWVWAQYAEGTFREDRVTRVNPVEVARDSHNVVHLCTRVDLATPTTVDNELRSYGVGVKIAARADLPEGPIRVTVNWIAGCPCEELPRGNVTALFE